MQTLLKPPNNHAPRRHLPYHIVLEVHRIKMCGLPSEKKVRVFPQDSYCTVRISPLTPPPPPLRAALTNIPSPIASPSHPLAGTATWHASPSSGLAETVLSRPHLSCSSSLYYCTEGKRGGGGVSSPFTSIPVRPESSQCLICSMTCQGGDRSRYTLAF